MVIGGEEGIIACTPMPCQASLRAAVFFTAYRLDVAKPSRYADAIIILCQSRASNASVRAAIWAKMWSSVSGVISCIEICLLRAPGALLCSRFTP